MYINKSEEDLILVEENIYYALQRLKYHLLEEKDLQKDDLLNEVESDAESWIDSDEEREKIKKESLNKLTINIINHFKESNQKCPNYQNRKQNVLKNIFSKEIKEIKGGKTGSNGHNEYKENTEEAININAESFSKLNKEIRNESEQNENKTSDLITKLLCRDGTKLNTNLFQNMTSALIKNRDNVEIQDMMANARRPIELDDIELEPKSTNEVGTDGRQTTKTIHNLFHRHNIAKQLSKGKSSVVQYLIENNRDEISLSLFKHIRSKQSIKMHHDLEKGSSFKKKLSKLEKNSPHRSNTDSLTIKSTNISPQTFKTPLQNSQNNKRY